MAVDGGDQVGEAAVTPIRPAGVEPGTAVLITGPAMTGKQQVMYDLLSGAGGQSAVQITTKRSAAQVKAQFAERCPVEDWELRVVDCVSRQQAVGPVRESDDVRYVTTAADLTGIGIAASQFMREFYHDDGTRPAGVGLHSLSTVLMYADLRRVYQFLHVLTGRIASSEFVGAFTFDTVPSDAEIQNRLRQVVDALVEVREGPELRVHGGEFGPREWTPYSPVP